MRVEWPTLLMIVGCYVIWGIAGQLLYPEFPLIALGVMAVVTAWHSSLSHEVLHGHPTRCDRLNEALVFIPLGMVIPYRRYKQTHIAHHHDETLTDPFDDPESYYVTAEAYRGYPRWIQHILWLNATLAGRLLLGPVVMLCRFIRGEAGLLIAGADGVRLGWVLHLTGCSVVLLWLNVMQISLPAYLLGVVWPAHSLILLRSFAEHRYHDEPQARTVIVERSPLSWLYLNNNLHLVHHAHPELAWYQLPAIYAHRKEEWHQRNQGYVYSGYLEQWQSWAFRAKENPVHPRYD